jgi:hypothetical protein
MKTAMRVAIGLVGLFNLMIGLRFLFVPAQMANEFALSPLGIPGMATMRADFPAFFLTGAAFALIGAWRVDAKALLIPLMLLGVAIFGRFVSVALDGIAPTTFLPMIAEAVMIGLLLVGYRVFKKLA